MKILLLVLATVITVGSVLPYARDIVKGTTRPNIVSWITWTLLTAIAGLAQFSDHEYIAAIFSASAAVETGLVVLLGLKFGYVKYTRFDYFCQFAALSGIAVWLVFDSPAAGVLFAVSIDFVGALPTLRHSWRKPFEETWLTFALAGLGGVFGALALNSYNWVTLPYAVYIALINLVMVSIIVSRQKNSHVPG